MAIRHYAAGTATYSYDDTNQVTCASYTGTNQPANEAYSFDANGNRTNTGYSTGTNNQLSSDGTFNYGYDAEGNRTSRTRISNASANDYLTTYTWDYRDRLTDVQFYNNSNVLTKHVHYTYDAFDHRISKSLDATDSGSYSRIEDYVYDGAHVVLDFVDPDGTGPQPLALATRYLNSPSNTLLTDQVFAQENASTGAVSWLLSDNLGTTRDIVDNSSTLLGHLVYSSFGQLAAGPTNLTRFLYTGEEWDADVGLQYNDHRWYDPAVGRWISQDPTGFAAGDTSLDRYAGNATSNAIDPTGLQPPPGFPGPARNRPLQLPPEFLIELNRMLLAAQIRAMQAMQAQAQREWDLAQEELAYQQRQIARIEFQMALQITYTDRIEVQAYGQIVTRDLLRNMIEAISGPSPTRDEMRLRVARERADALAMQLAQMRDWAVRSARFEQEMRERMEALEDLRQQPER